MHEGVSEFECVWCENISATRRDLGRQVMVEHGSVSDSKCEECENDNVM